MRKYIVGTTLALGLAACSNISSQRAGQPLEHWTNFGQSQITAKQLEANQSLAVFYRTDNIQGPAVNIYIDGRYQASLLPNALTYAVVCADQHLFTSSFTTNTQFGNRTQGVNYVLPANEVAYIKVTEQGGKLSFVKVDSAIAEQEIAQLPRENQTLSRVPSGKNCGTPALANMVLDAGALFAFNKSGYKDILPEGKQSIASFASNIAAFSNATKIVISGHTDPTGSAAYNQRLSEKRAKTVKTALEQAGVRLPFEVIGYGETQPVVTHCDALKSKAKQACNQPNRRVEITVYGNK